MKFIIVILALVSTTQAFAQKQNDNSVPNVHLAMSCETNKGLIQIKTEIMTTRCMNAENNKALQEIVMDSDMQDIGPFYEMKTYVHDQGIYISAATRRSGYVDFTMNTKNRSLKPGTTFEADIAIDPRTAYDSATTGHCSVTVLKNTQAKKTSQTVSCGE